MTERCLIGEAGRHVVCQECPHIAGREGIEGDDLAAVKGIFVMAVISGVLPRLGPFRGHVVVGAACVETQEVGHTGTIAAGEKSVKKFFQVSAGTGFCYLSAVYQRNCLDTPFKLLALSLI
jgi:hypothetical protein